MALIKHFNELHVHKVGFEASMTIFELSKSWPREEMYSLTDQIRRSSRSACASIAEAWAKRRYPNHFISKLTDADAEVAETQNWLDFALRCEYMDRPTYDELWACYRQMSAGLVNMMTNSDEWCGPSLLRDGEPVAYYAGIEELG